MILSLTKMRDLGKERVGASVESKLVSSSDEWAFKERLLSISPEYDIFLSHAYSDRAVVIGVYLTLKSYGFSLYVDWIHDPQLDRSQVTPTTANLLRQRMRQCHSLFYITTSNSGYSQWMPWETGYFDGYDRKQPNDGHVAILPVLDPVPDLFDGLEYLGLYCWADVVPGRTDRLALRVNCPPGKPVGNSVEYDPWISGMWP
jgi:hypothetical protein